MIDEAKRRSLLLFSLVGFFVLFCFFSSVDVLVHFCSPKKNKNLLDKSPLVVVITESDQVELTIR